MIYGLLIRAAAIAITALILPGVQVSGIISSILAALVLGLVNIFIRPLMLLLTLPVNILTLGLFTLVVNALMIMLAAAIVPGFKVKSFWWALLFGIVLIIVNEFLQRIL